MKREMGRRLRAVRRALDFHVQKEFADLLGVSPERYNQWEKGRRLPDIYALVRLKDKLGISIDYIVAGDRSGLPVRLAERISRF